MPTPKHDTFLSIARSFLAAVAGVAVAFTLHMAFSLVLWQQPTFSDLTLATYRAAAVAPVLVIGAGAIAVWLDA